MRAAIAPVPAIRTVPDGSGAPAANAVTTSPTMVSGQVRPSSRHIGTSTRAAGSEADATPATPRTAAVTEVGLRWARACLIAVPMATAAAEPAEIGLPGPAVPRPTTVPSDVARTAREAVPPASTPSTRSMVEIETYETLVD